MPLDYWTPISAISTFAAVITALFLPEIRRWWDKPVLRVVAELKPPACQLTIDYITVGDKTYRPLAYHLRLWIENTGSQAAENVQVFAAALARQSDNGPFVPVEAFLPMNLKWTHAAPDAGTFIEPINPGMGRHCELAHMYEPSSLYASLLSGNRERKCWRWIWKANPTPCLTQVRDRASARCFRASFMRA